ncbi:cation:proton antiporter [Methylocapsa sp. S129]|uniref:cation:proton antiporter domain-containing protein n=1 Tax=Methylocapsa sp. S129 TaxID=1641869 RepID=UPI00131C3236|nr:cation:proton antiporter [Methylocapsa sp. S129]
MNAPFDLAVYKETLLFLVTAGIVAPLFFRLRISPVLGFLLAGVALGPFGLGSLVARAPWLDALALTNVETIDHVAAFGVVFLLFMMGLELSFERLTRMRRLVFGLGGAQVVLSALLLAAIAFGLGQQPAAALVIGAALSLSSTAIIIPVLAERKRLNLAAGRVSFAILLFQDLAVAPLLFMVTMLIGGQENGLGIDLALTIAPAALALTGLIVLGRRVLRPLFHSVAMTKSTEFFMAACLLVVLGTGLIAAVSGLSMALGAFIAGLLLAETEYRREIEVTIEPFKGLLLGLFFVAVGAELDLSLLFASPAPILLIAGGLVIAKALAVMALGPVFRLPARVAREVALLLGPGGEFAFVMISAAVAGKVVAPQIGQMILVAVTLTMLVTPALARLGEFLAGHAPAPSLSPEAMEPPPEDDAHRVIIVGYGRVGALIGDMLDRHKIPYIAVDSDANLIARERRAGKPIFFGDATRPEFLRRCGVETARALVVTMDAPRANEAVVEAARTLRADLTLVARARDATHAKMLYDLGVTDAVPETIEASLQLSEAVLVDIGVPMGIVIASIHEKRDEYRKLLVASGAPARPRLARRK